MAINVLGGVTGIGPSSGQGHPTGGTGRMILPSFFIMLIYQMFYYKCHNIAIV